jgi:hypothetical protein
MLIPDFATMLEGYAELPRAGRRTLRWTLVLLPVSLGIVAIAVAIVSRLA